MKTTIEVSEDLLTQARSVARQEGATLKAIIEEGLRLALRERSRRRSRRSGITPFEGDGLTAEFSGAGWDRIRDEIYRDRG